ncbi:hypothetical protein NDU88_008892 [Pleurodeles waltl]|uniref:Uncharacterized protein n=1 Tax=Pleurodeles waltl TaxID=8319 RepID=A0AAV7QVX2_PLEWA|nr:hypothetical protein NDU88_008892 [Pleurodeles waltl]
MGAAALLPILRPCKLGVDRSRYRPQLRPAISLNAAAPPRGPAAVLSSPRSGGQARLPSLPAPFPQQAPLPALAACSHLHAEGSMPLPRSPPCSPLDALGARGELSLPPADPTGPPPPTAAAPGGHADPSPQGGDASSPLRRSRPCCRGNKGDIQGQPVMVAHPELTKNQSGTACGGVGTRLQNTKLSAAGDSPLSRCDPAANKARKLGHCSQNMIGQETSQQSHLGEILKAAREAAASHSKDPEANQGRRSERVTNQRTKLPATRAILT